MKKVSLILSIVLLGGMLFTSCGNPSDEVTIGEQVWMTKNLNVDKFQNGDPIPEAKTAEEWAKAGVNKQPAWCYYNNDPANGEKYGKLYNFFAVSDPRGLAPEGWDVPSEEEWTTLFNYLGGKDVAGGKMKSIPKQYEGGLIEDSPDWESPNTDASNESGFLGLPGGGRTDSGEFGDFGRDGIYWGMSRPGDGLKLFLSSYDFALRYDKGSVSEYGLFWEMGLSVRCIKN